MRPITNIGRLLISVGIVAFGVGVLGGVILNTVMLKYFSIANQIQIEFDVVGVVTLIVTIILAYIVSRILVTRDGEEKTEKENLINYFQTFKNEFTIMIKELAQNGTKLTRVTSVLKRHRMRAVKLIALGTKHNFLKTDSVQARNLDEHIKKISDLMTDTPQKGEVANGVQVTAGKLSFSEKQIDEIVSTVFDIDSDIFEITVEINRCRR